ncbi:MULTISPECIES: hypothetical protein [unclassified Curtobacterium]|nr:MULTISPECIES: hypothetical protein [unclassified Curtobacterium]
MRGAEVFAERCPVAGGHHLDDAYTVPDDANLADRPQGVKA